MASNEARPKRVKYPLVVKLIGIVSIIVIVSMAAIAGLSSYFFSENSRAQANEIRAVVIATGTVTTLAGSAGSGSVDGTGTAASFYQLSGITTDGTSLYVADTLNNEIRSIQP